MKQILITGGKGLIGRNLSKLLVENGYAISVLTRKPKPNTSIKEFAWSPKEGTIDTEALKNVDAIIHLVGAGIADKRWTKKRKEELYRSRIGTTNLLFETCREINHFPEVFISASGIAIYGTDSGEVLQKEDQLSFGQDFLANLTKDWEEAALLFKEKGTRVICLRTGIVLSKEGGALAKLALPAKLGLSAGLGGGKQYMSWIHIADMCNLYLFALQNNIKGSFNAVSSEPVTNKTFMKNVASVLSRPFFLPNVPALFLKIGLGELSDVLLGGNKVSNEKIMREGFVFQYPDLNSALKNTLC